MKRLNIKSVFTHHSQNGGVKKPSDSESADDGASIKVEDTNGEEDDEEEEEEIGAPNGKENKVRI